MAEKQNETPESRPTPTVRKPRDDGLRSRHAILDAAARLATTHGLEELSIGDFILTGGEPAAGRLAPGPWTPLPSCGMEPIEVRPGRTAVAGRVLRKK